MKASILECLRPGPPLRRVTWRVVLQPAPQEKLPEIPSTSPFSVGQPGHIVSEMRSSLSDAGARRRDHVLILFSIFLEYNTPHVCVAVRSFFVPIQNPLHVSGSADYATRAVEGLLHLPPPCIRRAREMVVQMTRITGPKCGVSSRNAAHPRPVFVSSSDANYIS